MPNHRFRPKAEVRSTAAVRQKRSLLTRSAQLRTSTGVRRAPFANEAETAIERDVVLIAEDRNRQIDGRRRSILARLGLGVFDCPARVAILLPELRGLPRKRMNDSRSLIRNSVRSSDRLFVV